MAMMKLLLIAVTLLWRLTLSVDLDEKGYIIYCPCMGRFGNQAEHFLGSLAFAKKLDRTLVLPPWPTNMGFIEFDDWFNMDVLRAYHRVVTAVTFMADVAPAIWPVGERIGFCYQLPHRTDPQQECVLKHGSPFGPFWNHLNVDFDSTVFYNFTYSSESDVELWHEAYPPSEVPVIALKGAPASFPARPEHVPLQKYLWWTDSMVAAASQLIYGLVGDEKFIAVHLRNGEDWERACPHAVGTTSFMSSPQCSDRPGSSTITKDMCLPESAHIMKTIRYAVVQTGFTNIYILTDRYPLISEIESALSDLKVKAIHGDPDIPQYDLIIAAKSELFIGNCISSFSAFIKRERDHILKKPSWFFGVDNKT